MERSVASTYPDWSQHATRIRDALKDLTADDLALRAGPHHDAFHAGEISQLLGVQHLPPIDLWARRPPA